MREVIIGILSTEEMNAQTKFSENENVYKAEFPSMYQNMGELIRCKDCRWYKDWRNCHMEENGIDFDEDEYCSRAERKEE